MLVTVVFAQQNVRAWYAQGQVWIVWQAQSPFPETFAIYKNGTSFTNINQATAIGRLFNYEYLPGSFIQQTGSIGFTYKIPKPDGSLYTLSVGEGLFVETVTSNGAAFYAVVEWGKTDVTLGVNIIQSQVNYKYDPYKELVNCHLQLTTTIPSSHKSRWYSMWAHGRQDLGSARSDFPVMANGFKNGMPAMFIVNEALRLDTSAGKLIPATHWFHGGGGSAVQSQPNDFQFFDIEPKQGISVSHNDDFTYKGILENGDTSVIPDRTMWFGWAKMHNPFNPGFAAKPGDTIFNYTQRRIVWINDWLIRNYHVNPNRVALQGYSMGSGGATALGKAYPDRFSTVTCFNNSFRAAVDGTSLKLIGTPADNLPTNLRGTGSLVVRIADVFSLTAITSPQRDFPLFRIWDGKNDNNVRMMWGPDVVRQFRIADSLGSGAQIQWDERPHTYETLGFHWIEEIPDAKQTYRDNLSYQETYRSNQSYPAFFNHRLDAQNNNPGSGVIGINKGDGDNWGNWGGYHIWDLDNITDQANSWGITSWLESKAIFNNDNCPVNSLTADLAIRKPQNFLPASGKLLLWTVKDLGSGTTLQNGMTSVRADGLVVLPKIVVYKESIRKVRIAISDATVASIHSHLFTPNLIIYPNPSVSHKTSYIAVVSKYETPAQVRAIGLSGHLISFKAQLHAGENRLSMEELDRLPGGFYIIEVESNGDKIAGKWMKM